MKTSKRQFLKSIIAAIPLSKVVDVEGSKNKDVAIKEQKNIDKYYRNTPRAVSGVAFTGCL